MSAIAHEPTAHDHHDDHDDSPLMSFDDDDDHDDDHDEEVDRDLETLPSQILENVFNIN